MATIEEKLYEAIDGVIMSGKTAYSDLVDEILPLISEQDRIARAEERERCIKAAISCICEECAIEYRENSVLCGLCETRVNIRKAMEE